MNNNFNRNPNVFAAQGKEIFIYRFILICFLLGSLSSGNPNMFPPNLTNYYSNTFNPNVNPQFRQNPNIPNMNYNPNLQQPPIYGPMGPSGGIGVLVSITDIYILIAA